MPPPDPTADGPPDEALWAAARVLLTAFSPPASRDVVEDRPILLREASDDVIALVLDNLADPAARRHVDTRRHFLARCRAVGTGAAEAEWARALSRLERIKDALGAYRSAPEPRFLDDAAGEAERALREPGLADLPAAVRADLLHDGGAAYLERYWLAADPGDLDRAIALLRACVAAPPAQLGDYPPHLHSLGVALLEQEETAGGEAALDEVERLFRRALDRTPTSAVDWPLFANSMGLLLSRRYDRTGDAAHLDRAIALHEDAVARTALDSPDLPGRLSNLGTALRARGERGGTLDDLDLAVERCEEAVAATPAGAVRPPLLANLGTALRARYERRGALGDLERAIAVHEEAVVTAEEGGPGVPMLLNGLGSALMERYQRTSDLADLTLAIVLHEHAAERAPRGAADRLIFLNNLGTALSERYDYAAEPDVLARAIDVLEEAVAAAPAAAPIRPGLLSNLALVTLARADRSGTDADWARAIELVGLARGEHDGAGNLRAILLGNAGAALWRRFARVGEAADLDGAIDLLERAVADNPPDSPHALPFLLTLGDCLYARRRTASDRDEAIRHWERGRGLFRSAYPASGVAYKVGQQRAWAAFYDRLIAAYLEHDRPDPRPGVAARRRALELAEEAKSRLLVEHLAGEDWLAPPGVPGELIDRERRLLDALREVTSDELRALSRAADGDLPSGGGLRASRLRARQSGRRDLEEAWGAIAACGPEAAEYARRRRSHSPAWADLARLAEELGADSALISLWIGPERTACLILTAGREAPEVVDAPLTRAGWADCARRLAREMGGRRPETWHRAPCALLAALRAHLGSAGRVVLSPSGIGQRIPWGAAARLCGWDGSDGRPLPLAQIPALDLLRRARGARGGAGRALVVGDPLRDLPHAEHEALAVAGLLGCAPLLGTEADRAAVGAALPAVAVAHFAAHASFSASAALDAGLQLADGPLTTRDILALRLRAALVVLSGCETGRAGRLGGDEWLGLAQAFLLAGARSLVVSLWRVDDRVTAALIAGFYREWLATGDAAAALALAMERVRDVPAWRHGYFWGGFVLLGAWQPGDATGEGAHRAR